MKTNIKISSDALRSLILATTYGPNCDRNISDLAKLYSNKNDLNIEEISIYFDANFGPISMLVNYIVTEVKRKNIVIDTIDIVKLYTCYHKSIIKVSRHIFFNNGFSDQYFQILHNNGFTIYDDNIYEYLFSCFGKVAIIKNVKNRYVTVEVDYIYRKIILENIYSPITLDIGDKVAIHFAGVYAKLKDSTFFEINQIQVESWFNHFKKIKKIDYRFFLGSNLSKFTESETQRLLD